MKEVYFSDRERGPRARLEQKVSPAVWGGLYGIISSLISKGAFGIDFPDKCQDGEDVVGTNWHTMNLALQAEIPDLSWPIDEDSIPDTLTIMDFIEFCHMHVAKPRQGSYHSFFRHYHLGFDRNEGQADLEVAINRIFSRNGLAYHLKENGEVERVAPPVLDEALSLTIFNTGDLDLDVMLETARQKYLSPDPTIRKESLDKLWDAWERIKTIEPGTNTNKKKQIGILLDKAASEPTFRNVLEEEAICLTTIGNTFQIRHTETTQISLERDEHVDYLFHRLFSMIQLLLRTRTT